MNYFVWFTIVDLLIARNDWWFRVKAGKPQFILSWHPTKVGESIIRVDSDSKIGLLLGRGFERVLM